jgi:hypothetical protein
MSCSSRRAGHNKPWVQQLDTSAAAAAAINIAKSLQGSSDHKKRAFDTVET